MAKLAKIFSWGKFPAMWLLTFVILFTEMVTPEFTNLPVIINIFNVFL